MAELGGEEEHVQDLLIEVEDEYKEQYIVGEEEDFYKEETEKHIRREHSDLSGIDTKDFVDSNAIEEDIGEVSEYDSEFTKKQNEFNAQLIRLSRKLSHMSIRKSIDIFLEDSDYELEEDSSMYDQDYSETYQIDFDEIMANMAVLPDLNKISLESMVVAMKPAIKKTATVVAKAVTDKGHFVDPLTGEIVISPEETEEELEEIEEEEESSSEESESPIINIEEDNEIIELLHEFDEEDTLFQLPMTIEHEGEKAMANFLEEVQKVPEEEVKESNSELLRQMAYYERQKILISEFLNALITRVVNMIEYIDEKTLLRKNLDKGKLFEHLIEYICDLRAEQRLSLFLNRKVVEHFRRKKQFRFLTEGNVDSAREEIQKYHRYIDRLDILLGYEKHAIQNKEFIENKLKEKLEELSMVATQTIEDFENLVRRTFIRPSASYRYVTAINTLIHKLQTQHQEVSEFRRNLIHKQSCIAELYQRLDAVEHLGDGLLFSDFMHQLTETITLSKLLDEREHQTSAMRKRYQESLEKVSHMMDKMSMEKASIAAQYTILKAHVKQKQRLRRTVHRLKLERLQVQQETAQVAAQSDLLSKPDVLLDYDVVVERIPIVKQRVEKLRIIYAKLSEKMNRLTHKCKFRTSISVK